MDIKESAEKYVSRLQAAHDGKLDKIDLIIHRTNFIIYTGLDEAKEYWFEKFKQEQEKILQEQFNKHKAEVDALLEKENNMP